MIILNLVLGWAGVLLLFWSERPDDQSRGELVGTIIFTAVIVALMVWLWAWLGAIFFGLMLLGWITNLGQAKRDTSSDPLESIGQRAKVLAEEQEKEREAARSRVERTEELLEAEFVKFRRGRIELSGYREAVIRERNFLRELKSDLRKYTYVDDRDYRYDDEMSDLEEALDACRWRLDWIDDKLIEEGEA